MKFSITKQHFQNGLTSISRLTGSKAPLPILNNILITALKNEVMLAVTNLELGIQITLPAKVDKEGAFTVPGKLLHEFIQYSPDATFELSVSDNATLVIKSDAAEVKIRGLDATEFPTLPLVEESPTFTVKANDLKQAVEMVSFATAVDDTRPVLVGIFLKATKEELVLAATDSYRLAEKSLKVDVAEKECSAIVPKFTFSEVARLVGDEGGDISVFVGENQIQFSYQRIQLVSQLIEGNYPNYQAIVPNEYQTRVTAHLGDFTACLKTASLFAREAGNLVKLVISPGQGMVVQSVASQKGEATSRLTAITEGEELTIAFNVKYLLDALSVIHADNIFAEMSGPDRPILLRPANSKEYLSLVMPLKID